jgi:hypothetical protein
MTEQTRRDSNTLRRFDAANPTAAQLRDMTRIIVFAGLTRPSTERLAVFGRSRSTLFGLAMYLRMSSRRLTSLVDGMTRAGMLTNDNGRLTAAPRVLASPPFAKPDRPLPALVRLPKGLR